MDQPTAEAPPGCLVVLIAQSAAMAADVRVRLVHREFDGEPDERELPALFAARFLADELLEGLAGALAAGYSVPLDVAVIGYRSDADGALQLTSLLPEGRPHVQLQPFADLAALPVEARTRAGEPRKWTTAPECGGTARAAEALAEVHRLVSIWLTGRYRARPPVVIHCTGGEGLDEEYARVGRSLGSRHCSRARAPPARRPAANARFQRWGRFSERSRPISGAFDFAPPGSLVGAPMRAIFTDDSSSGPRRW